MASIVLKIEIGGVEVPVIFEQDNRLPIKTMKLVFTDSGAISSETAGLASLSSELLEEGSKKDGAIKFSKELEEHAISLNIYSGNENFVISMEGLKSEFDFGLKKLKELLESPNYTEESMQKIVTQRVGMLMMTKSNFDYIASKNLKEILFKGTPLANPAYGTIESVKAITLKDIEKFLNSHLHLDNLIVIAGGDFQEDELKESLTKLLVAVPKGSVKPLAHIEPIKKPASKTLYEDTKQAYIYFGSPYFMEANSSKKVYGRVASFILGSSGFGSRLMEEIRVKRGLAYSAYSYFEVEKSYSYFTGYLQTKLESSKEAQDAVKEILKEFVEKGVTKEELEGAKKFFLGSEPLRTETLMKKLTRDFKEYYYGLGLGYHKKELQEIEKMKLEDLNEFIKSHKEIAELTFSIVTKK